MTARKNEQHPLWYRGNLSVRALRRILADAAEERFPQLAGEIIMNSKSPGELARWIEPIRLLDEYPKIRRRISQGAARRRADLLIGGFRAVYERAPTGKRGRGNQPPPPSRSVALGRRLRDARMTAGITLSDVAKRMGVTPQRISAIESGRSNMTIDTLARYTEAVNCRYQILISPG